MCSKGPHDFSSKLMHSWNKNKAFLLEFSYVEGKDNNNAKSCERKEIAVASKPK